MSVDVTFLENVFPFRRIQNQASPASLLWGAEYGMAEGNSRLGMFDTYDPSGVTKALDLPTLKTIGAVPTETKNQGGRSYDNQSVLTSRPTYYLYRLPS